MIFYSCEWQWQSSPAYSNKANQEEKGRRKFVELLNVLIDLFVNKINKKRRAIHLWLRWLIRAFTHHTCIFI